MCNIFVSVTCQRILYFYLQPIFYITEHIPGFNDDSSSMNRFLYTSVSDSWVRNLSVTLQACWSVAWLLACDSRRHIRCQSLSEPGVPLISSTALWVRPDSKLMSLDPGEWTSKGPESAFFVRVCGVNKCSGVGRGLVGAVPRKHTAALTTPRLWSGFCLPYESSKKVHTNQVVQDQSEGPLIVWGKMDEPSNIKKGKSEHAVIIWRKGPRDFMCLLICLFVYSLVCGCLFTLFVVFFSSASHLCNCHNCVREAEEPQEKAQEWLVWILVLSPLRNLILCIGCSCQWSIAMTSVV